MFENIWRNSTRLSEQSGKPCGKPRTDVESRALETGRPSYSKPYGYQEVRLAWEFDHLVEGYRILLIVLLSMTVYSEQMPDL
jgi:hypothetical protein